LSIQFKSPDFVCCRVDFIYPDKITGKFIEIDGDAKIVQDIRNIGNHLAGIETIAPSGKGRNITAADGVLFNDEDLFLFQIVVQCVGETGREPVNTGPDDNQVFFIILR
jgi:hypothetical protein